jgi:hypothetical protein
MITWDGARTTTTRHDGRHRDLTLPGRVRARRLERIARHPAMRAYPARHAR